MTDDELIAQAVAYVKKSRVPAALLAVEMRDNGELRMAVARHLLSRDPEAVRVPLKGTVS